MLLRKRRLKLSLRDEMRGNLQDAAVTGVCDYSDPRLLNDISLLIKHDGRLPRFSMEGVPRMNPLSWRFLPAK